MPADDVQEVIPFCIQCDYNLTALLSDRCPECGWHIDWALAYQHEELRRPGTPAYRAQGWRIIDQTLLTVLMMLFVPWRFAKQLRYDESLKPAICVGLTSFVSFIAILEKLYPTDYQELLKGTLVYLVTISSVILCQTLVFSTLQYRRGRTTVNWSRRFRLWLMVSFYSTCFVVLWPVLEGPPYAQWLDANFNFPSSMSGGGLWGSSPELGVSIITYWWWLILAIVLLVRNRPRWLAIISIPLVYVFINVGTQVFFMVDDLIDFIEFP